MGVGGGCWAWPPLDPAPASSNSNRRSGQASGAFALWARPSAVNLGCLSLNHSGHLSHTLSMHVCEAWCVTSLL